MHTILLGQQRLLAMANRINDHIELVQGTGSACTICETYWPNVSFYCTHTACSSSVIRILVEYVDLQCPLCKDSLIDFYHMRINN